MVERQRWRNVLGQRVERAVAPPEQQRMPRVRILVDRVEARGDAVRADLTAGIGVARDVLAVAAAGAAGRDRRSPRVGAQVDVQLAAGRPAAGLLPDEALEVAAVGRDGVDVVPLPADLALQRVWQPRRAVDRRLDPVRELLPARRVRTGRLRLRRRRRRDGLLRLTAARGEQRAGAEQARSSEEALSPGRW